MAGGNDEVSKPAPRGTSEDSTVLVSARSATAVQNAKCSAVENLRGATMGFLSTVGGRISAVLDDVGCLCMDDDDALRRKRQERLHSARAPEDPPLFPGGSQASEPKGSGEQSGQGRAALVAELADLFEADQSGSLRVEDLVKLVKQLFRIHVESDESRKDSRSQVSEAAVLEKLPQTGKLVPYRTFCDSVLAALDELVISDASQEIILEQAIAVINLEIHGSAVASCCKHDNSPDRPASELKRNACEVGDRGLAAASAPFRWVRHELSAIPERGESVLSYEAFTELVPEPVATQ